MERNEFYIYYILKNAPTLISQVDRDKRSKTYGSCDRNYWHLKIRDFSSAILQQAGLSLALLYTINFSNNIYYKNENIKTWAISTIYFWAKIQHADGSFDEYYPNEHGFPPTAFSLFAMARLYRVLKLNDESLVRVFLKTAEYLSNNIEQEAKNQEMAALSAINEVLQISPGARLHDKLEQRLVNILEELDKNGYAIEYGGADIGYLSVTLDMLAEYYTVSKDSRAFCALEKTLSFLRNFVHPNGTIGGEYGSRNTTYFLPNGIEVMCAAKSLEAAEIGNKLYSKHSFMNSIDDRYNSHYIVHSFLRALEKYTPCVVMPADAVALQPPLTYFSNCGLFVFKNEKYYAVGSLQKGGVIKIFDNEKELFVNCGYRINYKNYKTAVTNWQDKSYTMSQGENKLAVEGKFNLISAKKSAPIMHMVLRALAFVFGKKLIKLLKSVLIFSDKHIDVYFKREIIFKENSVCINDTILSEKTIFMEFAPNSSLRHVASGKFFTPSDLLQCPDEIIEICGCMNINTEYDTILQTCKTSSSATSYGK